MSVFCAGVFLGVFDGVAKGEGLGLFLVGAPNEVSFFSLMGIAALIGTGVFTGVRFSFGIGAGFSGKRESGKSSFFSFLFSSRVSFSFNRTLYLLPPWVFACPDF